MQAYTESHNAGMGIGMEERMEYEKEVYMSC